jgi:hypothetical protein
MGPTRRAAIRSNGLDEAETRKPGVGKKLLVIAEKFLFGNADVLR